jgi:uncharacterized protein (TIGR03437 family)
MNKITATKFDSLHRVLWSFSAPSMNGRVTAAAVDSHGSLIIAGTDANSITFPRVNPLFYPRLPTASQDYRGFLAKLDADGTKLMFSTLVGGNELYGLYFGTSVTAVAVDSADHIYLAGTTASPTFPVTGNAYQKTGGGRGASAFVMRISNAGNALDFSTYFGSAEPICEGCGINVSAIAVDSHGITVAGDSGAKGVPVTDGSYDCSCAAGPGVFVSRFTADASALKWSARLFNPSFSTAYLQHPYLSLIVDHAGNATVAVTTTNASLPVTSGAVQTTYRVTAPPPNGSNKTTGYLSTISSDGTTVLHSTYFGGNADSTLTGIVQDPDGNFWISGDARSADLPMPAGSLNLGTSYVAELNSALSKVLRYYGVPSGAIGLTINMLPNRDLVLSGVANSVLTIPENGPSQPSVWGVAGAAEPAVTPHIAPGELISLYGLQLGPDPALSTRLDSTGKVSTGIDGYRVEVNGIPAPLLYAGPNQMNVVVPFEVAPGSPAAIQVFTPNGPLTPITGLAVGPTQPQIFPVMLNEDGTINSKEHPAPLNSVITMWATGGGAMDRGMVDGEVSEPPLGNLLLPAEVAIGTLFPGDPTSVTYAGAAPGILSGVIQINFRVLQYSGVHGACGGGAGSPCQVTLSIGGRASLTGFPFSGNVYDPHGPVVWLKN